MDNRIDVAYLLINIYFVFEFKEFPYYISNNCLKCSPFRYFNRIFLYLYKTRNSCYYYIEVSSTVHVNSQ